MGTPQRARYDGRGPGVWTAPRLVEHAEVGGRRETWFPFVEVTGRDSGGGDDDDDVGKDGRKWTGTELTLDGSSGRRGRVPAGGRQCGVLGQSCTPTGPGICGPGMQGFRLGRGGRRL
ncbi:uncharacterized protein PgNI_00183 [Pyricularia grisea]|uniref:Uncharacterized protein n=1 Tax=Pyricularia grisea TaxID=148305 RepID=A0A6P8BKV8_PYRGI|nr:uncharacterized protein PgNI_00183 [Pyricularia grisea]TLD17300.1 hypothetical protein PgNI_00183 [Pyricularia grisea]